MQRIEKQMQKERKIRNSNLCVLAMCLCKQEPPATFFSMKDEVANAFLYRSRRRSKLQKSAHN